MGGRARAFGCSLLRSPPSHPSAKYEGKAPAGTEGERRHERAPVTPFTPSVPVPREPCASPRSGGWVCNMTHLAEAWQPGDRAGARLVRIWEPLGSPALQSSTGTSRVCLAAGSDLARAFTRGSGPQKLLYTPKNRKRGLGRAFVHERSPQHYSQ